MEATGTGATGRAGTARGHRPNKRLEILAIRVSAIEGALLAMTQEVRTRRVVVIDESGEERLVGEVVGSTAELRVEVGRGSRADRSTDRAAVVLHAGIDRGTGNSDNGDGVDAGAGEPAVGEEGRRADGGGLGALMGFQLWAQGDAIVELDAWPDSDGRWRPRLHLGTPS